MARLNVGEKLPVFQYDTPFTSGVSISDTVKAVGGKTALVFLRYYGCTLCQLDISEFAAGHEQIAATGGQMLIVLQSAPDGLAKQLNPGDLPFDIVCDPDQTLYKEFEIAPAASMEAMIGEHDMEKIAKAKAAGFTHGEYEGEELQLPAVFVVDSDLTLTYVHYGKTAGDVPMPEELAELLK